MTTLPTDLTLRKAVTVARPIDEAFALFAERVGMWWPVDTHSIGGAEVDVIFERRTGGRLYERRPDGRTDEWATVVAYDPPHRIVLEWKVGLDQPPYTEVEVLFTAAGAGTRVELEHRGWERLGERAPESAASYDTGWTYVLGRYRDAGAAPA